MEEFNTKKDILATKMDIEKLKAELLVIKWMLGFVLAGILSLIVKSFFQFQRNVSRRGRFVIAIHFIPMRCAHGYGYSSPPGLQMNKPQQPFRFSFLVYRRSQNERTTNNESNNPTTAPSQAGLITTTTIYLFVIF